MGKTKLPRPLVRRQQEQHLASSPAMELPQGRWFSGLICVLLILMTLGVYWQTAHFDLVDVDDPDYVINNVHVREGLTARSFLWAFNLGYAANWHPLTWISHMVDCQLFGLEVGAFKGSGGHHFTSVLLHVANSLLLFWILKAMTGALWRSGFVAALFALHPLHVESVAWVAERKDVLSTFFMLLTIWAYHGYVRRLSQKRHAVAPYCLALFFFACGLMSKQMLVSLPILLLMLDVWPLKRIEIGSPREKTHQRLSRVFLEKAPFVVMAITAALVVVAAQGKGGAITSVSRIPFATRIGNALVTPIVYLADMFWPHELAHYYPHEGVHWTAGHIGASAVVLVWISWLALRHLRTHPLLAVGWFWYLVTLGPVIGIVQIGAQARADRYTYIPLIGIFIIIAYGVPAIVSRWQHRWRNPLLAISAAGITVALIPTAHTQVSFWKNSETLYSHTLAVTQNNWFVHSAMASILNREATTLRLNGNVQEADKKNRDAIEHLKRTLKLMPNMVDAHDCLANSLLAIGEIDQAIAEYELALTLNPKDTLSHANLGNALTKKGKIDEAIGHYYKSLEYDPNKPNTRYNLALALERRGRLADALAEYRKTLELFPGDLVSYWTYRQIASLLSREGQKAEAIEALRKAVEINDRARVDVAQNTALNDLQRLEATP